MMRLDIEYARTKTLWFDLKIILKTIPALVVQMWDMHQKRKARSGTVQANSFSRAQVINQPFSMKSALLAAGRGDETDKIKEIL
jgi:hypothetical protein